MVVEIRKLAQVDRSKANYIRVLQKRGKIKVIVSEDGYVCYDTEELKEYKSGVKIGRPIKMG